MLIRSRFLPIFVSMRFRRAADADIAITPTYIAKYEDSVVENTVRYVLD